MVNLTINGIPVSVQNGSTILDAARVAGIHIPHLCYLKDLNEIGACRICAVEVKGEAKLIPACNNVVTENMVIKTNSPRVRNARRTNLELILSQHDSRCATCVRSGNCQLQSLANDFGILENPYRDDPLPAKLRMWSKDFPLIRDAAKCIKCMRCIQVCDNMQKMSIWDLEASGGRTHIDVSNNRNIKYSECTLCGQCITHCPVGALRERSDIDYVIDALDDPEIITVVQIAPAIRAAWGESLNMRPEDATVNRLAGTLRQIGFDYVFDTSYSADLTIMEEGSEFLERFKSGKLSEYPMFTSCCPGWIRFAKSHFPELVDSISTVKSPQQIFGTVTKTYFAQKLGINPSKICCVSVMPCVAKKAECDLATMKGENGIKDVDYVLTTREILRLLRGERVHIHRVKETPFDNIMGDYTGAGVIFGTTGGVMEAALRTAYFMVTGKNTAPDAFSKIRSSAENETKPWRDAEFSFDGQKLHVAVVSGLGNAQRLCEAILEKRVHYDFVEIMACPGGCVGGGGQPIHCDDLERSAERGRTLYRLDSDMKFRFSHENSDVNMLYKEYLGSPLSEKSHMLFHTDHTAWKMPGEE